MNQQLCWLPTWLPRAWKFESPWECRRVRNNKRVRFREWTEQYRQNEDTDEYSSTIWIFHLPLIPNWVPWPKFGLQLNRWLLVLVQGHVHRKGIPHLPSRSSSWDGEKQLSTILRKPCYRLLQAFNKGASFLGSEWFTGCFLSGTSRKKITLSIFYMNLGPNIPKQTCVHNTNP